MKQYIFFILFASLLQIVTSFAMAKTYTGRLEKKSNRYYITTNKIQYELHFSTSSLEKTIKKLKTNDYLSVEADLVPHPNKNRISKIKIYEINYVGLGDLVGLWLDPNGVCYFFSSFTKVQIFYPNQRIGCNYKSLSRLNQLNPAMYNYFINPNNDHSWNLLLANDDEQFFGELEDLYSDSAKRLTIYSAVNGDLLLEYILRKVPQ